MRFWSHKGRPILNWEHGVPIDDGSHVTFDMVTWFCYLYRRAHPHGVYLVEDVRMACKDKFGDGLRRKASFIELGEGLLDKRGTRIAGTGGAKATECAGTTSGVSFSDSVVAYGRASSTRRHIVKSGPNVEPR